ncbi:MAG: alpha/beta fold hydrolase [Candidatus Eiseniibacteriota bacterium]
MAMRHDSYLGLSPHGFHRVAYVEWGARENPKVLVCVHGLTRNARDFDFVGLALERDYRVIAVDVAGRGRSDWLDAAEDYTTAQYCADMAALIARLDVPQVDWLGTSMGGMIGMALAAQAGAPIRRLVLNDIGPFIPKAALARIAGYIGERPVFDDLNAATRSLGALYDEFGPMSWEEKQHLTEHSVKVRRDDGKLILRRDPKIADAFLATPPADIDLWPLWDAIRCPVLLLRGSKSDLLLAETAAEMAQRGPGARVVEFVEAGHAPKLMEGDQIGVVCEWLLAETV